jgi:hypothetical protein
MLQTFPKLQMTSSDLSVREHIHNSAMSLLEAIRVDDYTIPFMKAYIALSEVNGLLFQTSQPEVLKKAVFENSIIILRAISETRQMAQPAEEFWNITTVLLETFLSAISIIHHVPKEEVQLVPTDTSPQMLISN